MKKTNIAITGANSFIGRNFKESFNNHYNITEIDVKNRTIDEINFNTFDVVYHVAAIVHSSNKISKEIYFKVNSNLPFQIAQKAKKQGVKQFIFMSSIKVFGENTNNQAFNLETQPDPTDNYGASKLDAELKLQTLNDENFKIAIIRPPLVYGAGVKANMQSLLSFVKISPIIPLTPFENKRSYIYINNLIDFINLIIEKQASGIFLPSDGTPFSTNDILKTFIKQSKKNKICITLPQFFMKILKYIAPVKYNKMWGNLEVNSRASFEQINFTPKYSINEGMSKMANDFYKQNK
ncbi:MAG: NAD-dependent epimerase/dehydratase family protein [Bacteroidales bacterium]|nr:NAD-dependent epimerase/dehydratase family protein [Bacteroidales bacterium]